MEYEERMRLRREVSDIQRRKEYRARRMHIKTLYRTKLYLGGDARPVNEQIKSGYPPMSNKGPRNYG